MWVRGPQVMLGYHNNEEATEITLLRDGWLRTGDIVEYDYEGNVYVVDRAKSSSSTRVTRLPRPSWRRC